MQGDEEITSHSKSDRHTPLRKSGNIPKTEGGQIHLKDSRVFVGAKEFCRLHLLIYPHALF